MPVLRLFAAAREAAGTGRDDIEGATVGEVLDAARRRYGAPFEAVLGTCRVWVDGEPATDDTPVGAAAEVAVLPPVSGGAVPGGPVPVSRRHLAATDRRPCGARPIAGRVAG